jgi:hypothetical protein
MVTIRREELRLKQLSLLPVILCVFFNTSYAQDLTKEVYVVSSFRPELADVDKIGSLPALTDTFSLNTKIDYTILPSRIKSDYSLRPIKAANMVGTPLDKFYKSYLKLGLGNYTTPLVEYSIHNLRSKDYALGAYVFHRSSYTDLTLEQGSEVPANYARNELCLYGKKFYRKINLFAEAGGNRYSVRNYGLNEAHVSDSFTISGDLLKQSYNKLYAKAGITSMEPDSDKIDYRASLAGIYFWDKFKNKEPHVYVDGSVNFPVKTFRATIDGRFDYYNLKDTIDTLRTNIYTFRPVLSKRKGEWSVNLGARISILQIDTAYNFYIYPDANIKFRIISKVMSAVFGVTGYLEQNSYESMSLTNPYIALVSHVRPTNHPYIFYGGIDGYLSRKAYYRLNVSYEAMDDMVLFTNYNDSLGFQNQFETITDDVDRLQVRAEFNWAPLPNLDFYLNTGYSYYQMYGEDYPWHMPALDLKLTARYNFRDKVFAEFDFITLGKRYAKNIESATGPSIVLDPVYDLNLKLEYKYSGILSFFLEGYNLTNQHYYLWNQYRSQGFNMMAGLSYKF